MQEIEIYFSDDSELAEYEANKKGYRVDVFVKTKGSVYNVRVYDTFTLVQDFNREVENYGYYSVEPNLILVQDVNRKEVVNTIERLNEQEYFEELKATNAINLNQLKKIK